MTSIEILIAKLERVAADPAQPKRVRDAAAKQAAGYRTAWAAKSSAASR